MAAANPHGPPPTISRSHSDDLVTTRSDAHVSDGRLRQLLQAIEIATRGGGQVLDPARRSRGALPPRHPLVLRRGALQRREIGGKLVVQLAIDLVRRAQRDPVEGVEDVELGDREVGESIDSPGVPHDDRVEPSASPRTAGSRAELVAELPRSLAELAFHLGGQRSTTDTRRVRLHHAKHGIDGRRRDAGTDRGAPGGRVARCDVRIGAVIDVEQRSLRPLEQHRSAALHGAMNHQADVFREWQQARAELVEELERLLDADLLLAAEAAQLRDGMLGALRDQLLESFPVAQIEDANAPPRDLVLVRRPDAAACRADLLARVALGVDELVIRKDQMGAVADVESPFHVDAVLDQSVDLLEERVGIEDDAISDRAANAFVQDAAGDLVEDERGVAKVDRVTGIGASLVPDHPRGTLGENIHQLALAFVTPLRTDDDDGASRVFEHVAPVLRCLTASKKIRPGAALGALNQSIVADSSVNIRAIRVSQVIRSLMHSGLSG